MFRVLVQNMEGGGCGVNWFIGCCFFNHNYKISKPGCAID